MKNTTYQFLLFVLLIITSSTFLSCSHSKKISSVEIAAALPALQPSQINIPIKIYAKPFFEKAETMAPPEFTSGGWPAYLQTGCDFKYKYRFVRSGFLFNVVNNKVIITLNGNYQIAGAKCLCAFNKQASPWVMGSCGFGAEPLRKVQIVIGSQLQFNQNYSVKTITRVESLKAIDQCSVTLFNQNVTPEVLDSIRASVVSFTQSMDSTITGFDFSETINEAAKKVGKKVSLKNYGYMKVNPASLSLSPLNYAKDTLYVTVGAGCYPEITSDSVNTSVTTFLPPLKTEKLVPGFTINANAAYNYIFLDTLINQTLYNKIFIISGKKVIINNVDITGLENGRISMKVNFSGSKKGTLFLDGTPILNVEKQLISIPDLDYSLKSKDVALNVGKSLFNGKIVHTLREKASINVAEIYQKNRLKMDSSLTRTVSTGINTIGKTSDLKITGLVIKKDFVLIQARVKGELSVLVGKLDMK